jgi:hypothetical protein
MLPAPADEGFISISVTTSEGVPLHIKVPPSVLVIECLIAVCTETSVPFYEHGLMLGEEILSIFQDIDLEAEAAALGGNVTRRQPREEVPTLTSLADYGIEDGARLSLLMPAPEREDYGTYMISIFQLIGPLEQIEDAACRKLTEDALEADIERVAGASSQRRFR